VVHIFATVLYSLILVLCAPFLFHCLAEFVIRQCECFLDLLFDVLHYYTNSEINPSYPYGCWLFQQKIFVGNWEKGEPVILPPLKTRSRMEACFIVGTASNNEASLPERPIDGATGHPLLHCFQPATKPNQRSNLHFSAFIQTYIYIKYNFFHDLEHRGKYI
jgi:hypothetical protein